ncbi:chemotaxis protein CheA [Phenylobacterium sp. J367]|uniref:chemotaxis protein CheA n=1 Tax=Phenylobacterium sp. J367 TaxID=2898435 RepID=UPI002150AAE0|nr:chemotaxis protein CheA [Phenylobacterium sp. J367]MCR5881121.1 chemotaxis protein CheA [Phenylobacterium sp. J367]
MSDDLLAAFVEEARELLDQAADDLLALERGPDDTAALEGLFRATHTLKGSGGLIGFTALEQAFHAAEDRLSEVRQGARQIDPGLVGALAAAVEQAELWVEAIAASGELPGDAAVESSALVARLGAMDAAAAAPDRAPTADWAEALRREAPGVAGPLIAFRYTPNAGVYFSGDDPVAVVATVPGLVHLRLDSRTPPEPDPAYDPFTCNLVLSGLSAAPLTALQAAFRFVADQVAFAEPAERVSQGEPPLAARSGTEPQARSLRVDAARVDALAASADDLVVAKNALTQLLAQAAATSPPGLARSLAAAQADLDRRIARLHETIGRMRLVPLAPLFRRFPPIVRQLAASLGKSVDLVLSGEGAEVDKAIADGLHEPLLHLIRNAIDHGIEPTAERRAAGKPVPALLRLSAMPAGDQIVIELADDGRGLDIARVRSTAVRRGLASAEALAAMSDDLAADLIFRPGFSTAASVTELSGRGVGLDAVRARTAALGGEVSVHTIRERGTRFVLRLPVRVRLARLMMVEAAGETFGVPLESVVEATQVAPGSLTPVRAGRALVWRDRPVPLLSLAGLLAMPGPDPAERDLKVMIIRSGDELAAVSVDAFGDRIEAPLRPLAGVLARVPGVLGSSLLGDGRVLMVLDIPELIG